MLDDKIGREDYLTVICRFYEVKEDERELINEQELTMLDALSQDTLTAYVSLRKQIDKRADAIRNLANIMTLIDQCNTEVVKMDPQAISYIHRLILNHILEIQEALEDFGSVSEAKIQLEKMMT